MGRYLGRVVFVPFSAPGDHIEARVTKVKKTYLVATINKVIQASPDRQDPICPIFGQCGGCNWQHLDYSAQLRAKTNIVQQSFKKLHLTEWAEQTADCLASPKPMRYRNRIQVHVTEEQLIGFKKRNSHETVPARDCYIVEEEIFRTASEELLDHAPGRYEVFRTTSGEVVCESSQRAHPFGQINEGVNALLQQEVCARAISLANRKKPLRIIEFFAGSGNLTGPLREALPQIPIYAVEGNAHSVRYAREKFAGEKVTFVHDSCEQAATWLEPVEAENLMIVVDPPRAGLSAALLDQIVRLQPASLIYVSCDPMTLARDCGLLAAAGLELYGNIQPLDMFPQTDHVETVLALKRL